MKNNHGMVGVVSSPSPAKKGTNLTSLVSLSMQTITELNDPLAGKPVIKSKVQKSNRLSNTGKGVTALLCLLAATTA